MSKLLSVGSEKEIAKLTMTKKTVSTINGLMDAIDALGDGDEIIVEPGTYNFSNTLDIWPDGNDGLTIRARNDAVGGGKDRSILDFSNAGQNSGVQIHADRVTLRGFEVQNSGWSGVAVFHGPDQPQDCFLYRCDVHHNPEPGIKMAGTGHVAVECDSHDNKGNPHNADGFNGDGGSDLRFWRCRAWNNADDGYDMLRGPNCSFYHCWAVETDGGNGFKLGDAGNSVDGGNHRLERCVAYGNTQHGFTYNSANQPNEVVNCTAWDNGSQNKNDYRNFKFRDDDLASGEAHYLRNNVSLDGTVEMVGTDDVNNSWNMGISDPQFQSLTPDDPGFLRPQAGSSLIDAGVDTGVIHAGPAPDLGGIEYWNAPAGAYTNPSEGATNWHEPLNALWLDIEADLAMLSKRIESLGGAAVATPTMNTPPAGATDWHIPLNKNFTMLETAIADLANEAAAIGASASVTTSYATPSEGTVDWDTTLNSNFADIQTSVRNLVTAVTERE